MNVMKRIAPVAAMLALAIGAAGEASAGSIVYTDGPINGTIDAANITGSSVSSGFAVSDSFTVSDPATLTEAQGVGLWVYTGKTPTGLTWSIGTTPFASDVSSGTPTLSNTFVLTNGFGADVYSSSFAVSGSLSVGTYYFTLSSGSASAGSLLYWDRNNGPSSATQNSNGVFFRNPPGGESFTLVGDVPEIDAGSAASALALLGCGLAMLKGRRVGTAQLPS